MLPQEWRLMAAPEFAVVYRRGRRLSSPSATIFCLRSSGPRQHTKVAVVTSTKVSKLAVKRNLVRRRAWAVLRQFLPLLPTNGWFIVVVLRASAVNKSMVELATEFLPLTACVSSRT